MFVSLRFRIPAATIVLTLTSMATVVILSWNAANHELTDTVHTKLDIIARSEVTALTGKFRQLRADVESLSVNPVVTGNLTDLIESFDPSQSDFPLIQKTFSPSPRPLDLVEIEDTLKPTTYGRQHKRLHALMRPLLNKPGYADVLLIDVRGRIVYTTRKDRDFGRNAGDSSFATRSLRNFFQRMQASPANIAVFEDYGAYPVGSGPSALIGVPIERRANVAMGTAQGATRVGYLVIRLTPALLDLSAAFTNGLGHSGDLLILGQDHTLRGAPRQSIFGKIGASIYDAGLPVAAGTRLLAFTLPSGVDTLAVREPVVIMGNSWSVIATQARAEALEAMGKLSITLSVIVIAIGLLATLIALQLAAQLVGPLTLLTRSLQGLARGEHIDKIPGIERRDEIGAIAQAVLRIRDVTAEQANASAALYKRLSEENSHLANSDALTGLLNRRGFFARAAERSTLFIVEGDRPAVLMMDLDGFKLINDRHGHAAGDRVLVEVARRLQTSLPATALIARLGGDEFVVYLERATACEVRSAAKAIFSSMSSEIDIEDQVRVSVGISIGLSIDEDGNINMDTMLAHADTALYAAKQQGKNILRQYSSAMNVFATNSALRKIASL